MPFPFSFPFTFGGAAGDAPAPTPTPAPVRSLLLDDSGDLAFSSGKLYGVRSADAIRQNVQTRLSIIAGEWFLDTAEGLPGAVVLGKGKNLNAIRGVIRERIASTPGVVDVVSLDVRIDRSTRSLTVVFEATTDAGLVSGTSTLETI